MLNPDALCNRGRGGRLAVWRCNSDGRCIRREKSPGIGSSPGRTHNTGVIGLRWHCRRPAARPAARHGMPAVYENNISFCVPMIDIYSSVRPGIHCEKVRETRTFRSFIVLRRKSRRRRWRATGWYLRVTMTGWRISIARVTDASVLARGTLRNEATRPWS